MFLIEIARALKMIAKETKSKTRLKVPFRLKSPRTDCKSLMWLDYVKMRRMFKLDCLKKALID